MTTESEEKLANAAKDRRGSDWVANNASKRDGEWFLLLCSGNTLFWLLGIIVPFQLYEHFTSVEYMIVGVLSVLPLWIIPILFVTPADRQLSFWNRFTIKAQIWIATFSYVGNYLWTHYFFELLGAAYLFPSYRLNNVPIALYLITHAYFSFYHCVSNYSLRRVRRCFVKRPIWIVNTISAIWIFLLAYATAFMETLTISSFPYYAFTAKDKMYKVGSLFYAIYFFVSFPMFFRIDEDDDISTLATTSTKKLWTPWECFLDSLAASMLVTVILDSWRLVYGPIAEPYSPNQFANSGDSLIPFMSG